MAEILKSLILLKVEGKQISRQQFQLHLRKWRCDHLFWAYPHERQACTIGARMSDLLTPQR